MKHCFCLFVCAVVLSRAAHGEDATTPAAAESAPVADRAAYLTAHAERGAALNRREEVLWIDWQGARHWLVVQPATTQARGSLLLLADADASANGANHLAMLRRALPAHGWHTYFMNLPVADDLSALLDGARSKIQGAATLLVVCEGQACLRLADAGAGAASGLIFINVPLVEEAYVNEALKTSWSALPAPGLVLQEHPYGWPPQLSLAQDFELHVLPVGGPSAQSLVQRKLRGWLKRRLNAG